MNTLVKADATKLTPAGLDFDVKITAADVGKKSFTGDLKFAVVSGLNSAPATEKVTFVVDVK